MSTVNKHIRLRTLLIGILFGLCFAAIGAKAVYLQVYRASWLAKKAAGEYERSIKTYLKRGTIYDSTPREMAVSIDATSIAAFPGQIKNPKRTATVLAKALGSRHGFEHHHAEPAGVRSEHVTGNGQKHADRCK